MDPLFLRKRKYGWLAWTLAGALEISACLPKVIEVHQYPANPGSGILQTRKQKSMHSYLALGDSYTIGESVSIRDRYPVQTVEMLNKRNIPFSNPEIIAVTGWTSADLLRAIRDKQTPDPPFDVVSLLIGVNNQYQGRSLDEYKKEFSALLMQSIALAGNRAGHVIVLSIPDYAMTPFGKASGNQAGISAAIEAFNRINLEIAKQFQVSYIDVTTESRKAANDPALVAEDGLHYAAPEYTIWAKLLAARMETIFP